METNQQKPKKKKNEFSNKVTLSEENLADRALKWREQIHVATGGTLSPSLSDMVNFKLAREDAELTPVEVAKFREIYFTSERQLSYLMKQRKDAAKQGKEFDIQAALNAIMAPTRKASKPESKKDKEQKTKDSDASSALEGQFSSSDQPSNISNP